MEFAIRVHLRRWVRLSKDHRRGGGSTVASGASLRWRSLCGGGVARFVVVQPASLTEYTGGSRVAALNHVRPASAEPNTSPDVAPK